MDADDQNTACNRSLESVVSAPTRLRFFECEALQSVSIPASLVELGRMAFYQCPDLMEINIANDSRLTELPDYLFTRCSALKDFVSPRLFKCVTFG